MSEQSNYLDDLKQMRDELRLQVHLGSKELQDEWEELEKKWTEFSRKAELEATAKGVGSALESVGSELMKGYERMRKALQS